MGLRVGDRVHFPGCPDDIGTLIAHEHEHAFVIVWDEFSDEGPDVDECYPDGELYTLDAGHVVLVESGPGAAERVWNAERLLESPQQQEHPETDHHLEEPD